MMHRMRTPWLAGVLVVGMGLVAPRSDAAAQAPVPPALTPAFEAFVELGPPMELGQVPRGRRRFTALVIRVDPGPSPAPARGR